MVDVLRLIFLAHTDLAEARRSAEEEKAKFQQAGFRGSRELYI